MTAAPVARAVDGLLEATVAGSFTTIGYRVRRRLDEWEDPPRIDGRVGVVTGGNRGIGKAIATGLARLGARVVIGARSSTVTTAAAGEIAMEAGVPADRIEQDHLDLADPESVTAFARGVMERHDAVHALVHNAGALLHDHETAPDGTEMTVAVHLLGPVRLTAALRPALSRAGGRVILMSSGGMYAERLDVDRLEMDEQEYDGVRAYARAKRAQLALTHEMADRLAGDGVTVHVAHPGWVDTPGVTASLPRFQKVVGRLLRTPAEGADTVVWLAAGEEGGATTGRFWHDRRARREHWLPWTRPDDEAAERRRVWDWCIRRAGVEL